MRAAPKAARAFASVLPTGPRTGVHQNARMHLPAVRLSRALVSENVDSRFAEPTLMNRLNLTAPQQVESA